MVEREEFDKDPRILNVKNGLLNMETLELSDHSHDHLSPTQIPVPYNRTAKCLKILKFLADILYRQDIFTALQVFGYCLNYDTKFNKAFLLVGSGWTVKASLSKS